MIEIKIDDIDHLIKTLNEFPNHFIFRGHANADWKLESTLERTIGASWSRANAERYEDYSLGRFKSKFHLYDNENAKPETKLAWLSIMQHYGVPTRLLDFTESPYTALYFALEAYPPNGKFPFAVWAVDYSETLTVSSEMIKQRDRNFKYVVGDMQQDNDRIFENALDTHSHDVLWIAEPTQMNARLDRQAGTFLFSGNRAMKIEEVMNSLSFNSVHVKKLVIDQRLLEGVFVLLRKMNLTSKSMYGNLDGLARSIRMEMQQYAS